MTYVSKYTIIEYPAREFLDRLDTSETSCCKITFKLHLNTSEKKNSIRIRYTFKFYI